jgi:hypothetical protein
MAETEGSNLTIDVLYGSTELALFPDELDCFMHGFIREKAYGKPETDSKYWDKRIEYMQSRLRLAEVARKAVAVIASDARTLIDEKPEAFAELSPEQQAVLGELAGRIIGEE